MQFLCSMWTHLGGGTVPGSTVSRLNFSPKLEHMIEERCTADWQGPIRTENIMCPRATNSTFPDSDV